MKARIVFLLAGLAALATCARRPAVAQPRFWSERLQIEGGRSADKCSDVTVRTSGELAQATENFTLSKNQAPTLEIRAERHTALHVRGWDRPEYAVEVCKFAAAARRPEANQVLRSIAVTRTGARITATGPDSSARWEMIFFVHAPKDAALKLESGNGPVDAVRVSGRLNVHAENGPLSFDNCSGTIDGETINGPIAISGGSGDVHLRAANGPISLRLFDQAWNGPALEASTNNGPLIVTLPGGFHSGLRLETSGYAPISCRADVCRNARTEGNRFFPRRLQAGSGDAIRLSTHNGPVSISNGDRRARII